VKIFGIMTVTLDPLFLVLNVYIAMAVLMAVLWGLHLRVRNASIADVGFCVGLIAAVLWYAQHASGESARKLLLVVMVLPNGIWPPIARLLRLQRRETPEG